MLYCLSNHPLTSCGSTSTKLSMCFISATTSVHCVGKNILQRQLRRHTQIGIHRLENKHLFGCHVSNTLSVQCLNFIISFIFTVWSSDAIPIPLSVTGTGKSLSYLSLTDYCMIPFYVSAIVFALRAKVC